ncbi:MAG: glutamine amidotransferase [Planctomycetota bacterium]|nr:glutamine amidotransferase [Planctomycetota bacterium]
MRLLSLTVLFAVMPPAGAENYPLPLGDWQGPSIEVKGLKGEKRCATGFPRNATDSLYFKSKQNFEPGLYRLKLQVRPSHVSDAVAWAGGMRVSITGTNLRTPAETRGIFFGRVHEPETKEVEFVLTGRRPLEIDLAAFVDRKVFESATTAGELKAGGPDVSAVPVVEAAQDSNEVELDVLRDPATHFYYVLEEAALERLSSSAVVETVWVNKLRYLPGETLKARVTLQQLKDGAEGMLSVFLEHDVQTRALVKTFEVNGRGKQTFEFEFPLPHRELGHALVARYESPDGSDISESAEYFNIAENFFRVAIHSVFPFHEYTFRPEASMESDIEGMKRSYINCREVFFWAEEDMVELSPDQDFWFSGQTCYHMSKEGLKTYIDLAHERGIALSTYGKFIMSGYLGWKTAYDYPFDHKQQYSYPLGMWQSASVPSLDRFMNKEFIGPEPDTGGLLHKNHGRLPFMPINPDPTPHNVRRAAEEMKRSIAMLGWDGVRWDGHPRGGGWHSSTGGARSEHYNYHVQQRTELLVRYFKDIMKETYPNFRHGYNYLSVQDEPSYEWTIEDFEMDELCRNGGLLMNESIRGSYGQTFEWLARNLQVEADLCRERGGFLLTFSCDEVSERDTFVESILHFAAGSRPMSEAAKNPILNRYATRYSRYVFDETLRRLAQPEKVLQLINKPSATRSDNTPPASLWWDAFVYETVSKDRKSQLVVNLLNLPRKEKITQGGKGPMTLASGAPASEFEITLPPTYQVKGARRIDPFTLEVKNIDVKANRLHLPPINIWQVLVIDLERRADEAPTLAQLYGPPGTLGAKREGLEVPRKKQPLLDSKAPVEQVNADFAARFAPMQEDWWIEPEEFEQISWAERNRKILETRHPVEHYIKSYPYGVKLPDDLDLKDNRPEFGDMTPERNGVMDIFYARGVLDSKLRLYEGFARLAKFNVHEARFSCGLGGKGAWLQWNLQPEQFPQKDVMVYADITHEGIGVHQSYALVDYVKAGGGVLFTGGEYAFGKGRYAHTVLERELLPLICVQQVDNRYTSKPNSFEPGQDFKELGVEADFQARPAFWCWNQVALKEDPSVKVFLKSGNRPILVGWQLGKGRVACLMAMHRGLTNDKQTAFFDWKDWPGVVKAVLKWLSPDAFTTRPREVKIDKSHMAKLREEYDQIFLGDSIEEKPADADLGLLTPGTTAGATLQTKAETLDNEKLPQRIAFIKTLLQGEGTEIGSFLADQLAAVDNLPNDIRFRMVQFIQRFPPENLREAASRCISNASPEIRGFGYQTSAIAGSPAFSKEVLAEASAVEINQADRQRYLALAIAVYSKDDLVAEGISRVTEWNAREIAIKARYTGGKGFSMATPEQPCLDIESIYARVGWLTYLSQFHPEKYAAQFTREWSLLAQLDDWSDRSVDNIQFNFSKANAGNKSSLKAQIDEFRKVQQFVSFMSQAAEGQVRKVFQAHPKAAAEGLVASRFLREIKQVVNLMGGLTREQGRPVLEALRRANHSFLAEIAEARLVE